MRIDPKTTVVTPVVTKTARDAVAPKAESKESAAVVALSSAGTAVVDDTAAKEASEAKVARISQLIARGEYKVDLDLLAARLCEDEILRGGGRD